MAVSEFADSHMAAIDDYAIPFEKIRTNEVVKFLMARGIAAPLPISGKWSRRSKNTRGKAMILFLSDHGFRYSPSGFYDSITNVNGFRVVFDKMFHLNLPLLKDSVIFLRTTGVANDAN